MKINPLKISLYNVCTLSTRQSLTEDVVCVCVHVCMCVQIRPYFERCLKLPKHNPGAALAENKTQLTTAVLPIYVAGVLGCFHKVGYS